MIDDPNFMHVCTIVAGLLLLLAGIAISYGGYREFIQAKRIKDTPTSQIGGLTDGYRGIKGRVVRGENNLKSPMTGKQCVYYAFTVADTAYADGEKVIICDEKSTHCYLEDSTGTAVIELDGADLVLDVDHHDKSGSFNSVSPELEAIVESYGKSTKGVLLNKQLTYKETIVEVGDELHVLGPAKVDNGNIFFKAAGGASLIVSDISQPDVFDRDNRKALETTFAGLVSIAISVGLLAFPGEVLELIQFMLDHR